MRASDQKIENSMIKSNTKYQIGNFKYGKKSLRYLKTGDDYNAKNIAILFIHGAPGGLDAFLPYLENKELQKLAVMYSVDRLGYGYSDYGNAEPSISEQAKSLEGILQMNPDKKFILVGHSFGGPIAAYLAYLHPEKISELFLLGSASDPKYEKFVLGAKIVMTPPFKWLASADFKVASIEKINHQEQLDKIHFIWKNIKCHVHIVHGEKDWIVSYANSQSMQKWLNPNVWEMHSLVDQGHTFIFTNPHILSSMLLETVKN